VARAGKRTGDYRAALSAVKHVRVENNLSPSYQQRCYPGSQVLGKLRRSTEFSVSRYRHSKNEKQQYPS
jgi:hypothetical protein